LGSLHLTGNGLLKGLEVVLESGEETNKLLELGAVLGHLDGKTREGSIGDGNLRSRLRGSNLTSGISYGGSSNLLGAGGLDYGGGGRSLNLGNRGGGGGSGLRSSNHSGYYNIYNNFFSKSFNKQINKLQKYYIAARVLVMKNRN